MRRGARSSLPRRAAIVPRCGAWRALTAAVCFGTAFRCRPPPLSREDVNSWTLRGDKGLKNGERKLRTAITRRPEWRDEAQRSNSAAVADSEGLHELAQALRCRDSSRLRKPMLFELCRLWRLRSDIWEPRPAAAVVARRSKTVAHAPRRAQLMPPSPAPQLTLAPALGFDWHPLVASQLKARPACAACHPHAYQPRSRAPFPRLQTDALHVFLARDLDCCLKQHRAWSRLPNMHAALELEPLAPARMLAPAGMIKAILPAARWLESALRADANAIVGFAARLAAQGCAGEAPAWRVTASLPPLAERAAQALLGVLNACASTLADTQATIMCAGAPTRPSAADVAYVADITRSLDSIAAFIQRAESALAQLRGGSAAAYLAGGAAVCERAAAMVHQMAAVALERVEWQKQRTATMGIMRAATQHLLPAAVPPALLCAAGSASGGSGTSEEESESPGHLRNFVGYVVATRLLPDEPQLIEPLAPFVSEAAAGGTGAYSCLRAIAAGGGSEPSNASGAVGVSS